MAKYVIKINILHFFRSNWRSSVWLDKYKLGLESNVISKTDCVKEWMDFQKLISRSHSQNICTHVPSVPLHLGHFEETSFEILCIFIGVRYSLWIHLKLASFILLLVNGKKYIFNENILYVLKCLMCNKTYKLFKAASRQIWGETGYR